MSFPPQFLDEIRARLALADAIGPRVRLVRRGREHVGLCPFHNEKTPSFTVSEDKGFFHCFGCGAHGDVIGFAMRIDNLTFPEAVERLAAAAGLAMPVRTPEDRERAKERTSLYTVLEAACAWFEARLAGDEGEAARDYLVRRGLDADTIAKFRLGWAPDSRGALKRALAGQGVSETMMVAAGLLVVPDDGGAAYDRFRGRIVFPIGDRSGRVVAFGGRALGEGKPKYLNSPETPLFHKGALLYGLALARKPARDAGEAIVAEGYMDVIALHRAGFENAVAPLGTALSETQIRELWRLAPEPVICFDGDAAGRGAAYRAVERALPLLQPGLSLRFAALPAGDDPDSFISRRGAQEFRDALAAARPLADLLWEMEAGGRPVDTPERRAGVKKRLYESADRIGDVTVRGYYKDQFNKRLRQAIEVRKRPVRRRGRAPARTFDPDRPPEPPLPDSLGTGTNGVSERRERYLVAMIVHHPELLGAVEEAFATIEIASAELDGLRRAVLEAASAKSDLDSETLKRHLSAQGLATAVERLELPLGWSERRLGDRNAPPDVSRSKLEKEWRGAVALHQAGMLEAELRAAYEVYAESRSEEALERFNALRRHFRRETGGEASLDDMESSLGRGNAV